MNIICVFSFLLRIVIQSIDLLQYTLEGNSAETPNHSDIGPVCVAKLCSYCSHCRKLSDGLFLEVCEEISKLYPTIEFSNMIIDNCAMQVRIARDREPVPGWVSMQNDPHTGLVLYWALPAKKENHLNVLFTQNLHYV